MSAFWKNLRARWEEGKFVCVGLDSDPKKLPKHLLHNWENPSIEEICDAQLRFNKSIIDATKNLVCAYKPNLAFYRGASGLMVLQRTIEYIHEVAPGVMVILDAKQGDIGNTNDGYVDQDFVYLMADGVTVHNYMGWVGMKPYLDQADKGVIVLVRTSNEGSDEMQEIPAIALQNENTGKVYAHLAHAMREDPDEAEGSSFVELRMAYYEYVAWRVEQAWNYNGNCGVVVGATRPSELGQIRRMFPSMPTLLPGIGAQGGEVKATVVNGRDVANQGMIINVSRACIFAGDGEDFAEQAAVYVIGLNEQVIAYLVEGALKDLGGVLLGHHFHYSSGAHGEHYVNIDPALPNVDVMWWLAGLIVYPYLDLVDTIVVPATGGIPLGVMCGAWALSHGCKINVVFADSYEDEHGVKQFRFERAGFEEQVRDKRVLIVDDVMTNANPRGTVFKLCRLVEATGGQVVAVRLVCNRCGGTPEDLGVVELTALLNVEFVSYDAPDCPFCREERPMVTDVGHGETFREKNPTYLGGFTQLLVS